MNTVEEKIAEIIRENSSETAAKTLYSVMKELVKTDPVYTEANIYRRIDLFVDTTCERVFS